LTATLTRRAENHLRNTYSLREDVSETFEDQVTQEIPPQQEVTIVIEWKQVWLLGSVVFQQLEGPIEVRVPYRVMVGLTFDTR
jgi:hypothetical protein